MATEAKGYYAVKLAGKRLAQVYGLASYRVRQYLDAEIDFVRKKIQPHDRVLELGCGYGRVLEKLAAHTGPVFGIDTSLESLLLAGRSPWSATFHLAAMNAVRTAFKPGRFDLTLCIQNGISAFRVDPEALMTEAVRITRPGGTVLFSSYADRFWPERLDWFRRQALHGLVGEIDETATGSGVITCKDGFTATTMGPDGFHALTARLGLASRVTTVDESSVFCEITVS